MKPLIDPALDRYVEDHASPESSLLSELREVTLRELPDAQMQVGRVEGTLLRMLCRLCGARRVLELGTFSGYSTLCLAEGLPDDGEVVTCDRDPGAVAVAQRFFDRSPHGRKITVRLGPAAETIEALSGRDERFDLVFIDADKESYVRYWDMVLPLVPVGGIVVADNTLWGGRVLHPAQQSDHGVVAFNERVRNDPRVEHVLLPVRDGIMLARKQAPE